MVPFMHNSLGESCPANDLGLLGHKTQTKILSCEEYVGHPVLPLPSGNGYLPGLKEDQISAKSSPDRPSASDEIFPSV
jgi:hypothetical protein